MAIWFDQSLKFFFYIKSIHKSKIDSCYKYLKEKWSESEHESSVLSVQIKKWCKNWKEKYYLFILIYKLKDVYIF